MLSFQQILKTAAGAIDRRTPRPQSGNAAQHGSRTPTHRSASSGAAQRRRSGEPDVLAPRPFRPLAQVEGDRLPFSKIIKSGLLARGIVKEVLDAVASQNETEALLANEPLDGAVHRCHVVSSVSECRILSAPRWRVANPTEL